MKNILSKTALIFAVIILFSGLTIAQQGNGNGNGKGNGPQDGTGNKYGQANGNGKGRNSEKRLYDVNTVESISGTITNVERSSSNSGNSGTHLEIKTENGTESVHLGPTFYTDEIKLNVETGNNVTVIGSRITYEGEKVIVAREVTFNGNTFKLREMDGTPEWRGKGQGKNRK